MIRKFFSRVGMILTALFGIISLVAVGLFSRYRRKHHDAEASAAEDEARAVKKAAARGDNGAVLDSFRRATDKDK